MYIQQIIRGIYVSVHKFLFTISSLFYPILSTLSSRVTWVFLCNIFKDKKGQRPDGLWHCSSMVYVFRVKIMMSSLSDVEFLFTSSPNPLVPSSTSSARSSASISSPSQILILAPLRCCSPLQSPPYMKDKYLMALVKLNTQYCIRKWQALIPTVIGHLWQIQLWDHQHSLKRSTINTVMFEQICITHPNRLNFVSVAAR